MVTRSFKLSSHATMRLEERWPDTILRPENFSFFEVGPEMPIIGFARGGFYYKAIGTPMVAVVVDDEVVTVYDEETANTRLELHGYGRTELRCPKDRTSAAAGLQSIGGGA